MTKIDQKPAEKRRWGGFLCPECSFIFRVPKDHDGVGTVCPACQQLLRIPKESNEVVARLTNVEATEVARKEVNSSSDRVKKRRRMSGESSRAKGRSAAGKRLRLGWNIFLSLVVLALMLFAKSFLTKQTDGEEETSLPAVEVLEEVDRFEDLVEVPSDSLEEESEPE